VPPDLLGTGERKHWSGGRVLVVLISIGALGLLAGSALADPASDLSEAEARQATAAAAVGVAEQRLDAARAEYANASRRAGPAAETARSAQADARNLRARLLTRQRVARAEIATLEADRRQELDEHDEQGAIGFGLGFAALVAAAIALTWGWFRASAGVAALVRVKPGPAVAVCLGGGLVLVLVGAAVGAGEGVIAALGMAVFCLGFILPAALLLGRHSAEVQRGRTNPIFGRERMPTWFLPGLAALLFLLGVGALGSATFAEEPEAASISAHLREDAVVLAEGRGAFALEQAQADAASAAEAAAVPLARQQSARADWRTAARELRRLEVHVRSAIADIRRSQRRLASVELREAEAAERQANREAREAEEFEEFEEEIPQESEQGACDPNYSGCVPLYPPDVDCAEVGGSVSVYGSDPHGLDADSDGVGCE
jgi:hypothetical protein